MIKKAEGGKGSGCFFNANVIICKLRGSWDGQDVLVFNRFILSIDLAVWGYLIPSKMPLK